MIRTLAAALAISTCIVALATPAAAQTREYNIPAGSLKSALDVYVRQSGRQVVYRADEVRSARSPGTRGKQSAEAALTAILAGSGFTTRVDGNLVAIVKSSGNVPDAERVSSSGEDDASAGQDIVVTGSNIRGAPNRTVPLISLDRKYIESTGYATTTELINSIPQNFAQTNPSGVNVPGVTSQATQGAAINLRGLGEGTTLVLLNGRRMPLGFSGSATDISAFPLSAIERVEVLTDGASAIYGSDAVGGVVNFVLRKDFDGAETRLYGGLSDGANRFRLSQAFGKSWETGNFLVSGEYFNRELLKATERSFIPTTARIGSLYPKDENYSLVFSGNQELSSAFIISADALYSDRSSYNEGGLVSQSANTTNRDKQLNLSSSAIWALSDNWRVTGTGGYASDQLHQVQRGTTNGPNGFKLDVGFNVTSALLKVDGKEIMLLNRPVGFALGVEWRHEDFSLKNSAGIQQAASQNVKSAFAEVSLPLILPTDKIPALRRLEVSAAARFDDYSSFGSSIDPRIGVMWEPINGIRFRGSYGTSYVAPRLKDYSEANLNALAYFDGGTHYLFLQGAADPDSFVPQRAKSFTLGFEIKPESSGFSASANYYNIRYNNKISDITADIFVNPAAYSNLVISNPSAAQVNAIVQLSQRGRGLTAFDPDFNPTTSFDPSSIGIFYDLRRRNISRVETSGIDMSAAYAFALGENEFKIGIDATHIFKLEQRINAASAPVDVVDTVFNPADWRFRTSLFWQRHGFGANIFVNYVDKYRDLAPPPQEVGSYTTVDARISYDFGSTQGSGMLKGLRLSLSAQNLLDRDPPAVRVKSVARDLGFDPTNADPTGRIIALELTKRW